MTRRMTTSSTGQEYRDRFLIDVSSRFWLRASRGASHSCAWRVGRRAPWPAHAAAVGVAWRICADIAGARVEHLENAHQPSLHLGEPFLRVAPEQLFDGRGLGFFEYRRRRFVDAPAHAGKRQPVGEHQLLDVQHALDVGAAIDARTAGRFRRRRDRGIPTPTIAGRRAARWRSRTLPMP